MTNSPPSNVKVGAVAESAADRSAPLGPTEAARVLATGIDTFNFSMQVNFPDKELHNKLACLKSEAQDNENKLPVTLAVADGAQDLRLQVYPGGGNGMEYLIGNDQMVLSFSRSERARGTRPSVMVELKSEPLWHHGFDPMVERVLSIIRGLRGGIVNIKPSRADLCCDVLIRESDWHEQLRHSMVTRAHKLDPHVMRRRLSGFSIGTGIVSARLYDKPFEIECKGGGKRWFFKVWGVDAAPGGHLIVRVEFQLRREWLKNFGVDTMADFREKLPALLAYLTRRWLRLVDDASKHHTMQAVLPWWEVIQNQTMQVQHATPAVRREAIAADKLRVSQGLVGYLEAMTAILLEGVDLNDDGSLDPHSVAQMAIEQALRETYRTSGEFTRRVKRKQAKRHRSTTKFNADYGANDAASVSYGESSSTGTSGATGQSI